MNDDIVKSSYAALRCSLRHCGVPIGTSHSSGLARLTSEAFYKIAEFATFNEAVYE
jgi:hypothetical protein